MSDSCSGCSGGQIPVMYDISSTFEIKNKMNTSPWSAIVLTCPSLEYAYAVQRGRLLKL